MVEDEITLKLELTVSDRIILEKRITQSEKKIEERLKEGGERRILIEKEINSIRSIVWMSIGLATASLTVQIIRIIAILVLKKE